MTHAEDEPKRSVMVMKTSKGDIRLELFDDAAPKTVKNFIDLAEGKKPFTDPKTNEEVTRPFYDGLVFHRVIKDFMIQGGCPLGTGTGSPGYRFEDEISAKALGLDKLKAVKDGQTHPWLMVRTQTDFQRAVLQPVVEALGITNQEQFNEKLDELKKRVDALTMEDVYRNMGYQFDNDLPSQEPKRGMIAMANSGPNTNGSQFFINVGDTPHLTGKHTVFGKVIEGMDVVDAISTVPTGEGDKPSEPVVIESLRLVVDK